MRFQFDDLNTIQKGSFGEAFARMAFTLERFEVYSSEYDDRGIDFVARSPSGIFYVVQVKTTDPKSNPFIFQSKFQRESNFIFAAVRINNRCLPELYVARGTDWEEHGGFLHFNPSGGKSGPYYEMRFATKHASERLHFEFSRYVKAL